jgi:hypothetical protein
MGNWGGAFTALREPVSGRSSALWEQIQQVTPAIVQELNELQSHAAVGGDSVVAETVNTVTRIQDQVQELLAFCQVNHRFQPDQFTITS